MRRVIRSSPSRSRFDRPREGGGPLLALLILAPAWAILPLLPALWKGDIPGSRFTDLYPSVWGLGWFAAQQPGLPTWTTALAAPAGMPFYYSSPLHGWAGTPLVHVGGAVLAYVVTLVGARIATVVCAYGALRALGAGGWGALAGALVYGASPFFQGYAVEGIVEGTDGWALPLWVWAVASGRRLLAAPAFLLVVASSWYLAMVGCLVAVGWGIRRRLAWGSAGAGLLLAAPLLYAFTRAAGGATPLPDAIRAAMGAPLTIRSPGVLPGENIFALTTWVGLTTALLALASARRHPGWALGAVVCFVLSTGLGPWYHLPVLASVRFPYRWHAGTLWCLAPLVAASVDAWRRPWLAMLPFLEGLLLSPIEPVLPSAPADVPALYDRVRGPLLLEVPGPVALPPGTVNPSRPRARYLLYDQLHHGAASPWAPDFNGISAAAGAPWLATFARWDPVAQPGAATPEAPDVWAARAAGVTQIMVHRGDLGGRAEGFEAALTAAGAELEGQEGSLALYRLP